jgi:transposase
MSDDTLFPIEPSHRPTPCAVANDGSPRLRTAQRDQIELRPCDLESLLPADHPARSIWSTVERMDLSRLYASIQARGSQPGRSATDPKILVALWIYATKEGVGRARELARLCEQHDAYRWICGGVSVNYHTLSDFRVSHDEVVNGLLSQVLAVLTHQGIVTLDRVAQDGLRVRASAGKSSFRRKPSLAECLAEAEARIAELKRHADAPDGTRSARQRAAEERAAREREERLRRALAELPKVGALRESRRGEARVSTTDAEARVMKMGDGGFRPAYNVQLATDVDGRAIVGVSVTNAGTDTQQMAPMLEAIEQRTGKRPRSYLVDGGFINYEAFEDASAKGVQVVAPVKVFRKSDADPHVPKADDSPVIAEWRVRMGTDAGKAAYTERASTAETVNADLRGHRGLTAFNVRGVKKVRAVVMWAALTYNVMRALSLGVWT